jgi:hypothetical protein
MGRCCKLDRQQFSYIVHPTLHGQFYEYEEKPFIINFQSCGDYKRAGKHAIRIQYVNMQVKFRYYFSHPQLLWYSGCRIGGNMELDTMMETTLVAYRSGDLVAVYN